MSYGFSTGASYPDYKATITCNTSEKKYTVRTPNGKEKTFKTFESAERFREKLHLESLKTQAGKKRTRTVFPTSEIPHLWMHKVQASARNSTGSLYFEVATIFSYGSHFPIAQHVTRGKKSAVLFNSTQRSVTTSGHQSAVRVAIPKSVLVFDVPTKREWSDVVFLTGADALQAYRARIEKKMAKLAKVHSLHSYRWIASAARESIREMRDYAKFFRLKTGKLPKVPELTDARREKLSQYDATSTARRENARAARAERWARERREWEEKQTAERAERARTLEERIERWKNGESVLYTSDFPSTLLRISGDDVITSLGARVPVSHACRGLKIVEACVSSQREYVRNGQTVHLGHYAIDKIEANGTLHAGCHVIAFDEIQRIAPTLRELCTTLEQTEQPQA